MIDYDDPGWGAAFKVLIPFAVFSKKVRTSARRSALIALRLLYMAFVTALVLYVHVLTFIVPGVAVEGMFVLWVANLSVIMLVLDLWLAARPLDITSERALVDSYRTNFFFKLAASEVPALAGFALAFVGDSLAPYLVGMVAGLLGLAIAAPTRANIERRQREISARGSTLSLGRALVNVPGR
ncbi:MAG TPA: hypothetical protein VHL78_02285 [Actinomycetota bacterium]|nr:hypothetical protein [Actinomycetota bacterium]